jgi:hypothetical protein
MRGKRERERTTKTAGESEYLVEDLLGLNVVGHFAVFGDAALEKPRAGKVTRSSREESQAQSASEHGILC